MKAQEILDKLPDMVVSHLEVKRGKWNAINDPENFPTFTREQEDKMHRAIAGIYGYLDCLKDTDQITLDEWRVLIDWMMELD